MKAESALDPDKARHLSRAAELLQNAVDLHQAGQLAEAERAYRKLLRLDPFNGDGLRLLGGLYLQTGQAQQAADSLRRATRLLPQDLETATNYALALKAIGQVKEAEAQLQAVLETRPDFVAALNQMGSLYHDTGRSYQALTLYSKVLARMPHHPPAHFNYANMLFVVGRVAEAISGYEQALKLQPDYLEAMINLGMALSQIGQGAQARQWLHQARQWFDKALRVDSHNVVALNNMGNVLRQLGSPADSLPYFRAALRLRPDYGQAAVNLATSLRDLGHYDEALDSCREALRHIPNFAVAHINMGALLQDLMRHSEAITHFDAALALKPESLDAGWNKALSLLALGDYRAGWALHEIGLGVPHMRGENPSPQRRWQGEDFTGKRLLLWCEQGLGDTLQFIRYAEMAKARGGTVLLMCPRALRGLLRHCPFIDALPENIDENDFDIHSPLMSLPFVFDTLLETIPAKIPYLFVGDAARGKWTERLRAAACGLPGTTVGGIEPRLKVGLVWSGNPREQQLNAHLIDRRRSMPLELLRPLCDVTDVRFYNLQMGAAAAQINTCGLRDRIVDVMDGVQDFEDTAAIIEQLDLVITVDTSVAHLAGGMGKPVWILSRYDACWRWLQNRADNPWYPTAQVFGQRQPGDWVEVVARIRAKLQSLRRTAP